VKSAYLIDLEVVSDSLNRLRKEILYQDLPTEGYVPPSDPEELITLKRYQVERLFTNLQQFIQVSTFSEQARIQRVMSQI
jgi:hypothetical protein